LAACWTGIGQPIADCCSGLFGDLELDRPAGLLLSFLLNYRRAVPYLATNAQIIDS